MSSYTKNGSMLLCSRYIQYTEIVEVSKYELTWQLTLHDIEESFQMDCQNFRVFTREAFKKDNEVSWSAVFENLEKLGLSLPTMTALQDLQKRKSVLNGDSIKMNLQSHRAILVKVQPIEESNYYGLSLMKRCSNI